MNLMFWKKKSADEDSEEDLPERSGDRDEARKSSGRKSRDMETSEDTQQESSASPAHPKRRLIIAAAIVLPILGIAGLAIWKISPAQLPATVGTSALAVSRPESLDNQLIKLPAIDLPHLIKSQPRGRQADIDALKKKNEELQAQIETLNIVAPQAASPVNASRKTESDAHKKNLEKVKAEQYQANVDAITKKNSELQSQIEALMAELPQIEKAQAEQHQATIDAITKKNNELQAQVDALYKRQQQLLSDSQTNKTARKAYPPVKSGEIAISSKNPKAAIMSLKEAIEAMNAGSDSPPKKAAK